MSDTDLEPGVANQPPADEPKPVGSPRRRRRGRFAPRPRRVLLSVAIVAVVGVAAFVVVAESLSLIRHAKQAQASLEAFKTALKNNDSPGAARDLRNADLALAAARSRYHSTPLTIARHIPILGWPVGDAGHLLTAATDVSSAGHDALGLYDQVRGSGSKLFHNSTVSLPELQTVSGDADRMVAKMDAAERELKAVHAAFWEPSVGSARDKALAQVTSLRDQGVTAQKVLNLAPGLVGAKGPRTYLIAVLNPGELQFGGGSALNVLTVNFRRGHMSIVKSGATFDLTNGNAEIRWPALPEDPWLFGHKKHELAAADRSPDFRTSAVELMRGYQATFHHHLDGIIALDPVALADLMTQVPAFTTPGYGQLNAQNLVQKLLVDAYVQFPDFNVRHQYNDALMHTLLSELLGGGHMIGKGKSALQAAQAGHLQLYMNDPQVQAQVASAGLLRTLPAPTSGDVIANYTNNTNASKVDVWQHQRIDQKVVVHSDGSVDVTRTVAVTNAAPRYSAPAPYPPVDPGNGYLTRISRPEVAMYLPTTARGVHVSAISLKPALVPHQERGLRVIVALMPSGRALQPGQTLTVVLRYSLPPGTARGGVYTAAIATQATVEPVQTTIEVTGPGHCNGSGTGWSTTGTTARFAAQDAVLTTRATCA